jgi:hypothetical protein
MSSKEPLNIELRYARFQDFWFIAGLIVSAFLIGFLPRAFAVGNVLVTVIIKAVLCGMLIALMLLAVIRMRISEAPHPWLPPRTRRERIIAGALIVILDISLCVVFVLM